MGTSGTFGLEKLSGFLSDSSAGRSFRTQVQERAAQSCPQLVWKQNRRTKWDGKTLRRWTWPGTHLLTGPGTFLHCRSRRDQNVEGGEKRSTCG